MDTGLTSPAPALPDRPEQAAAAAVRYPPDAARCAGEMLSIVAYLTSRDGPLQAEPGAAQITSRRHEPLLRKAAERLEVIDAYMRARVSFLVAGRDRGYHTPEAELDLAGATLDAARATTVVVDCLLASSLPTRHEFDTMSVTALRIHPALDALRQSESPDVA
jgi:hypothetical protein